MRALIIAGGGITGLAAALIAAKGGRKVIVLEAADKFGGLLNTFEIGGNKLEYYYHHFFTHDAELLWLLKELELEDQLFFKKTSMGVFRCRKIYYFNGPGDLLKFNRLLLGIKYVFDLMLNSLDDLLIGENMKMFLRGNGWKNCFEFGIREFNCQQLESG